MKHKYLLIALVLSLGLLLLNTACGDKKDKQVSEPQKVSGPMMLMDESPPVSDLDISMRESKEPMPLPGEELQIKAKADAVLMSAMLEDIKPEEEKEPQKVVDPKKPRPIPGELPPPQEQKKK
jgi:hypothetical protein